MVINVDAGDYTIDAEATCRLLPRRPEAVTFWSTCWSTTVVLLAPSFGVCP